MKNTTKNNLSEFTIEEARGWVIDSFNQIDWRLNKLIVDFFNPLEKKKFETIILNTSVIDIGGKLKIIFSLGLLKKNIIEKIRKLSSIRNGFAHANIVKTFTIKVGYNGIYSTGSEIEIMNSSGLIQKREAIDYLKEYNELYNEIIEELDKILGYK